MKKKTVKSTALKRASAAFMAASVLMALSVPAFGETVREEQSLELTMQKPPKYTMSIPSTTSIIVFGTENTEIGDLSVIGDVGTKQQVLVTVAKTDFVDDNDKTNSFSFSLQHNGVDFTEEAWTFNQLREEPITAYGLIVHIPTETWAETKAGTYKATLTFKAELQDVQ